MLASVSLGQIGATSGLDVLRRGLSRRKEGPLVDSRALNGLSLALARDPQDGDLLINGTNSTHANNRGAFILASAIHGSKEASKNVLAKLRGEKHPAVFSDLAIAAGLLRVGEAIEFLKKTMKDERRGEFRVSSSIALGLMAEPDSLELILNMMKTLRSSAQQAPMAFAVALFGDQAAITRAISSTVTPSVIQGVPSPRSKR